MMENIALGLELFLTTQNFLAIAAGVLIGAIVGAIPGLSVTMAIALALPFTFALPPITGMLLLVGIYKGGVFGGSITAILINTPGTAAAACTSMDGYAMAKKGQSGKALHMALYASCIADMISNFSLIFFAGIIASFALAFGPPEYFWLIAFSLTIVVAIAGSSLTKGIIAGLLGLLVSTVGLDIVYGTPRFTAGSMNLMGGFSYIPLLIGLFALPEIIGYYLERSEHATTTSADRSRVSLAEFKRSFPTILRGSFIGVVLGAIPGIGPAAASFLSYGEAKRYAKNPEDYGKGEVNGVAAAEAGNNGVAGATLIPLLALGIPGDVVTAVILGAFLMQGLTPGPLLFETDIDLIYALFMGMIIASAVLFFVGSFAIRYFAKISDVPRRILMPAVLTFCVFGSFAVQYQMFDVAVMIGFGILGYTMLKFGMAVPPFLIGYILGPMFEDNLRRSYLISDDISIFFRSGICWFFIAATILSLYIGLKKELKATRDRKRSTNDNNAYQMTGEHQ